jgi:predicted oxidoreductase
MIARMNRYNGDVVVIGGGLAGIVAALELLDAGKRVVLVDRAPREELGGLAKESFGGILFVGTPEQARAKVQDTPEIALRDWLAFGDFGRDAQRETWPRRWAESYVSENAAMYRWLRDRGLAFLPMPLWVERNGNSVHRWHVTWGTGEALVGAIARRLLAHAKREALELHFDHRVESLIEEGGRIAGCRGVGETDAVPFEARGGAIVVAAGGINGDMGRVRRHWHRDWGKPPATILNGAHRFADGRMHDAVGAVGGRIANLDRMWNYAGGVHHWKPRKPDHGLSLVPPRSALWLDAFGTRIGAAQVSGFDTRDLVARVCARERQYSWQVLNRRIALKELAVSGAEFNPSIRSGSMLRVLRDMLLGNRWLVDQMMDNCIDFVSARTLPELVDRMNALQGDDAVRLDAVCESVEGYDAEVARGPSARDEQVRRIAKLREWRGDRMRTCNFQRILDPKAMPLIAIREFVISRKSLGGAETDLESRALDLDGAPIPGLFAVGEAAGFGGGGMNGLRSLEGTFLGGCIHTARRAAAAIGRGA